MDSLNFESGEKEKASDKLSRVIDNNDLVGGEEVSVDARGSPDVGVDVEGVDDPVLPVSWALASLVPLARPIENTDDEIEASFVRGGAMLSISQLA